MGSGQGRDLLPPTGQTHIAADVFVGDILVTDPPVL